MKAGYGKTVCPVWAADGGQREAQAERPSSDPTVVEVTLLDPEWGTPFSTGPFYYKNVHIPTGAPLGTQRGFGQQLWFASFSAWPPSQGAQWSPTCGGDDPWTDDPYCGTGAWRDAPQVQGDIGGDNCFARYAQATALKNIIQKLKHNKNIIWEVANEAENFDNYSSQSTALNAYEGILNWEQWVVSQIIMWDPKRDPTTNQCIPGAGANHLIQINGHYWNAATQPPTTSAWASQFSDLANEHDLAESLHYTFNWNPTSQAVNPGLYGAIDFWRPITSLPFDEPTVKSPAPSPALPVGFNEGRETPGGRGPDAVRSEALEFMTYGGARYDGYSLNYEDTGAQQVSVQLGYLMNLLSSSSEYGLTDVGTMHNLHLHTQHR